MSGMREALAQAREKAAAEPGFTQTIEPIDGLGAIADQSAVLGLDARAFALESAIGSLGADATTDAIIERAVAFHGFLAGGLFEPEHDTEDRDAP